MMQTMTVEQDKAAYYQRLGRALAALREATRMTREEAAARIGVNPQTLGRWERAQHEVSAWGVARIAEVYRLDESWYHELLDLSDSGNPWVGRLAGPRQMIGDGEPIGSETGLRRPPRTRSPARAA